MKIRLSALFVIALIIGVVSCNKKNNDAPAVVTKVRLNVLNASVDTVNIYQNGSRLNTTSAILPGYSTGYYYVPKGQQTYEVRKPFNVNTSVIQNLFSITVPADTNYYRTLFITDAKAEDAFLTRDVFKTDTSATADSSCYIRFVNSSPASGAVDISYGNVIVSSNVAFQKYTDFVEVNTIKGASITGLIPLKIFSTGSSTPLYTDSVSLTTGAHYTIYTLGTPGVSGFTFGFRQD